MKINTLNHLNTFDILLLLFDRTNNSVLSFLSEFT